MYNRFPQPVKLRVSLTLGSLQVSGTASERVTKQINTFLFFSSLTRSYHKDKDILCRRPIEPLKDDEKDNHLFPVADICS